MLLAGPLAAQVAAPSPLVAGDELARAAPGGWFVAQARAESALQAGFPATAAAGYRGLLRDPALPAELRQRVTLALVTALMDAGQLPEAEAVLQDYDGPRTAAYHLRAGLLAAYTQRLDRARDALASSRLEDLPPGDKGWWHFLQAMIADAETDAARKFAAFTQAQAAATSELQRLRFQLGHEQMRLTREPPSEAALAAMRANLERAASARQQTYYEYVLTYAASLSLAGRRTEALAVLQNQLALLQPAERSAADQFRLLLGLIAGEDSVTGRRAFQELLRNGQKPENQRLALQLLARGAKTPADREQLRRDLTELIGAPAQHPIIEDLLLARAEAALADRAYAQAEEDGRALLERYPGSPLRAAALGVRLAVAWDGKRYRAAADLVVQMRGVIAQGRERAELGVLLAEAFFRTGMEATARGGDGRGDYRSAADAYDAALRELPAVVPVGTLIFQRVLSDIRAEQLESAARQLDEAAGNPAFDPVSRWQAEWNLVKEMQVRGQAQAAYARVDRLLTDGAGGVPLELRIRLMWLRARLSFDSGQHAATLQQADELLAALAAAPGIDAGLRSDVASTALLLKGQALLALERDEEGAALLDRLRAEYRGSNAAVYSYIVQAARYTQREDLVKAQELLNKLADEHKESEFAPVALYEAALNEERLGLDRNLRAAYTNLLERLIRDYPRDELVFYARLKQGDLLRKLNDLPAARQVYEFLVNNDAGHPDVLLAQLALADTLFAQSANSVANFESASTWFERLRDLPTAPVDLRAEAGYKWGYALAKRAQAAKEEGTRDQLDQAVTVLWSVVDAFLVDPAQAAQLGAKGRYWLARSLLELGQLHEEAGQLDEARRAYQLIVEYKLYGSAQAQAKLARFQPNREARP
ncbi:MAG: hypothetical protein JNG83_01520 [Opitutaceae bacterium]|nr:hypothetical protein [Opitutaceae bacterium]